MTDKIRNDIGSVIGGYLTQEYSDGEQQIIQNEIHKIAGCMIELKGRKEICSYEEVQEMLSCLNEKEIIRKRKGVYYTPNDIVRFILTNSVKLACGTLAPNNLHETDVSNVMDETLCYEKTIYDPTCVGCFFAGSIGNEIGFIGKL